MSRSSWTAEAADAAIAPTAVNIFWVKMANASDAADEGLMNDSAGVSEKELKEWAEGRSVHLKIAAALARQITAEGWHSWHPVPANSQLARMWDCSPDTAGRAKRLLRERRVLICEKRAYYVA